MKKGLKKFLKIFLIFVISLILFILTAKIILLDIPAPLPDESNFVFDLEKIRELAATSLDSLPVKINVIKVGEVSSVKIMATAGEGFGSYPMAFTSFQIMYAEKSIIVDAVHSPKAQEEVLKMGTYDDKQFDSLQHALLKADKILVTHEHLDHVDGILESPYAEEILPKTVFTKEQIKSLREDRFFQSFINEDRWESLTSLDYQNYFRAAPGIVLIKAPGHSPGSQMIFIMLKNGLEFLILGDSIWDMDNIRKLKGRPLLISWLLREDRKALAHQLRTLRQLYEDQSICLLPFHDRDWLQEKINEDKLGDGFQ